MKKQTAPLYYYNATLSKNIRRQFNAKLPEDRRHMTLLFLGEQPSEEKLVKVLNSVASENKAFFIKPKKLEFLGKNKNVLAAVGHPSYKFNNLIKDLSAKSGITPQFKNNKPHVSLNYNTRSVDNNIKVPNEIPIKSISLMRAEVGGKNTVTIAQRRLQKRNILDNVIDFVGDRLMTKNATESFKARISAEMVPILKNKFTAEMHDKVNAMKRFAVRSAEVGGATMAAERTAQEVPAYLRRALKK